jgi:hypothetical protein
MMDVVIPTLLRQSLPAAVETARMVIPDPNIILLTERGVLGEIRNKGLAMCNSEFVVFIDDDVLVNSYWFRRCMETLQDPETIAVQGSVREGETLGCLIVKRREFLLAGGFPRMDCHVNNTLGNGMVVLPDAVCYHYTQNLAVLKHVLVWVFSFFQTESKAGLYHNPKDSLRLMVQAVRKKTPEFVLAELLWMIKTLFALPFILEERTK